MDTVLKIYLAVVLSVTRMVPSILVFCALGGSCVYMQDLTDIPTEDACYRIEPCVPNKLLSNTIDCRKYWQCLEKGVWVERQCPYNGKFDYLLRFCVHTGNATCQPPCPNMACNLSLPCHANTIIPNPQDCQRFYQCSPTGEGTWQERTCSNGTQFDHLREQCSPEAACASVCSPLIPATTALTTTTLVQSEPANWMNNTRGGSMDPCSKTLPCEPGSVMADTSYCERFFECSTSGIWSRKTCPIGKEFDYKKGVCERAGSTSCHPLCPGELYCERSEPCTINSIVPDPYNCQRFYQCDASLTWARLSCGVNLYFDMRYMVCTEENIVRCHPECLIDPCKPLPYRCPKVGIRVPLVDNCSGFYKCPTTDGQWMVEYCRSGERFDYFKKECLIDAQCHPGCYLTTTKQQTTNGNGAQTTEAPGYPEVISHTLEQVTPEALEGQAVEFQCFIVVTPDVPDQVIAWFLHGLKISSVGSKFSMNQSRIDQDQQSTTWIASLRIDSLQYTDSGLVNCTFLSDSGLFSDRGISLDVLARPVVSVSEMSATIFKGDDIALRYFLVSSESGCARVAWYRNETELTDCDEEKIIKISDREYRLEVRNIEKDVTYGFEASNKAGKSRRATCEVTVTEKGAPKCPLETVSDVTWPPSAAGQTSKHDCPGNATGVATRMCKMSGGEAKWEPANLNDCVDQGYREVMFQISDLESGLGIESPEVVTSVAYSLEELTNTSISANKTIKPGNLKVTVASVTKLGNIHELKQASQASQAEIGSVVRTTSNLLFEENSESWRSLLKEDRMRGVALMSTLDKYSSYLAKVINQGNQSSLSANSTVHKIDIDSDNIALTSARWEKGNMTYPGIHTKWRDVGMSDKAIIPEDTLISIAKTIQRKDLMVSNIYYRTLQLILPVERDSNQELPSRVMAINIEDLPKDMLFDTPVHLEFAHRMKVKDKDTRTCSFWNYSSTTSGSWSGSGCQQIPDDQNITICECNHLTNFAILVSRYRPGGDHHYVLSLLTTVGLSLSIVCMVITIIIYGLLWKSIKSDYALMLMNICGALITANLIFLVAITQTKIPVLCAVIAALLHYLFLAAFFLMLAEAVELLLYVVYVFHIHTTKETAGLLIAAWGIPLVIVGISLGITQGRGYGNEDFCWLTLDRGLIWAFLGPVIAIILTNFCILGVVLRTLFASGKMRNEKQSDRIRSAAWNVLILSPTLGLSWTFGLFAINENTLAFQYIFTSLNAFQGLFIFVFHCLLNKRIRDAFSDKYFKELSMSYSSTSHGGFKGHLRKGSLPSRFMTSETQLGTSGNFRGDRPSVSSPPGRKTSIPVGASETDIKIQDVANRTSFSKQKDRNNIQEDSQIVEAKEAEDIRNNCALHLEGAKTQNESTTVSGACIAGQERHLSYDNQIFKHEYSSIRV